MEIRYDRGQLQRPVRRDGALVIEGHAARVHRPGDPLRYAHGDEYRDVGELARIAEQLPGKPVTLRHPNGLIVNGATAHIIGRVDAAWLDGEHVAVRVSVTHHDGIADIESGTKELSLGYGTDVDATGYQRGTEVDHLAVVPAARCGGTCSLRVDDSKADSCGCNRQIDQHDQSHDHAFMPDKTDQERADELAGENKQLKARIVELEGLVTSGAQAAETEAVKKEKARADEAEAKVQRFDETFNAAVRARAKLEREALGVLGVTTRLDDMSERAIHEAVVKRLDATADVKAPSDAELRGQFNALLALAGRNAESQARVGEILARTTQPQAPRADEESYDSMMRNAWKKNLNGRQGAAEGR